MSFLDIIEKRGGFGGDCRLVPVYGNKAAAAWVVRRGRIAWPTIAAPELRNHRFTPDESKRAVESILRHAICQGYDNGAGRRIHGLTDWIKPPTPQDLREVFNGIDRGRDLQLFGWSRQVGERLRAEEPASFTRALVDVTLDIGMSPDLRWLVHPDRELDLGVANELHRRGHLPEVMREANCPIDLGFVLTPATWQLHYLGDEPIGLMENPPHSPVATFYGDLVCTAPWRNGVAYDGHA